MPLVPRRPAPKARPVAAPMPGAVAARGEVSPEKCEDPENFADPQTKYLTYKTWARHLHYTHNLKGDPPPRAEKKKKVIAVLAHKNEDAPWGQQLD